MMAIISTSRCGGFVWYELMTTDTDAAGRFYADVVGWTVGEFDNQPAGYRIFSAGEAAIGGLLTLPAAAAEEGMRPGWFGYIGVDDVDAVLADITSTGGAICMPPTDIPDVGRLALVADPQGAFFYVMRGASGEASSSFDPGAIGHCAWNELATSDPSGAIDFYTCLFSWAKGETMSMGEAGDYQLIDHAGVSIGAIMPGRDAAHPSAWGFYFKVGDVAAAAQRAAAGGGTILHGPSEVPGGDRIIIGADPQGAIFSLVGK
jgi:uncharacterized protein